jgi:hypothetical protein
MQSVFNFQVCQQAFNDRCFAHSTNSYLSPTSFRQRTAGDVP